MSDPRDERKKAAYEAPAIVTWTARAILETLGPATAFYQIING